MAKPKWMSDPAVSSIPQEKLDFLSEMFDKVKGKNKNELMPFLMSMSGKFKNSIHFSTEEMHLIIAAIKRAASSEEQAQIDKVLDMAAKKVKKEDT